MMMKQEKTWKPTTQRKKAKELLAHQESVSRLVGVALMLVSLLIFGIAGSIANPSGQGILGLLGIAVIALGLTLLITGATFGTGDGE